jgi:hypothetical protein
MPCSNSNCSNFTPTGDGSGEICNNPCGVQMTKVVYPAWDQSDINAPDWERDRIMYYYDDVCESSYTLGGTHDILGSNSGEPSAGDTEVEYGTSGYENPNAGKVRAVLGTNYWWENRTDLCPEKFYGYGGFGGNANRPNLKVRYWDNYPSEISFEPISSDTWFSYIWKTSNGVVGKPCFVMCYYMYTRKYTGDDSDQYTTYYGIKKVPFTCECKPLETYVNYEIEDGKITDQADPDPYPIVWSVGTNTQKIAFQYLGGVLDSSITVRAVGNSTIQDSRELGPSTLMYTTSGGSITELYSELGTSDGLFKSDSSSHRYNTQIECRSGSTVVARLNATFRPVMGLNDLSRSDSKFQIIGIESTSNTIDIVSGATYDLYVRKETKTDNFLYLGEVQFTSIVKSTLKKGIAITFHVNEPIQVTSGMIGSSLSTLGFYKVWDGSSGPTYQSPQGNGVWAANNTVVIKDYTLPNGAVIKMQISSVKNGSNWYTNWKIIRIIRRGFGYKSGDGVTYTGQNTYYLYYPNESATNKVGIALMVSTTQDGEFSQGSQLLQVGDTINGWTISRLKHTDDEFNTHVAELIVGSNSFTADTTYISGAGINIKVLAGWGIVDRAMLIGRYEFQRKEIIYATAFVDGDVPQEEVEVIKPTLQAVIENGRITNVQILNPGKNLNNPKIEPIKIAVDYPPTYIDHAKYVQYLEDGSDPDLAWAKSRGTGKLAKLIPVFSGEELIEVKVINGGSGYSSTKPPYVNVPYIAKAETTELEPATTVEKREGSGPKMMFERSEVFQTMSKTMYTQTILNIDYDDMTKYYTKNIETGAYEFDSKKIPYTEVTKSGFTYSDYEKIQNKNYEKKSYTRYKGGIKDVLKTKNLQLYVAPKMGTSKTWAQQFLPPTNSNRNTELSSDYKKLLGTAKKIDQQNAAVITKDVTTTKNLIAEIDKELKTTEPSLNATEKPASNDANIKLITDDASTTISRNSSSSNIKYYSDSLKNFYKENLKSESYSSLVKMMDNNDKNHENNINSLWERDLDSARTFIYDGPTASRVKYAFYNLPCATADIKYMVSQFCPDPRPHTIININLAVKIAGKDYVNDRGPCKTCIQTDAATISAYNSLVSQYGSGNVSMEDAWCQVYAFPTYYDGEEDGLQYGIPFGSYNLPYSEDLFEGYTRSGVKTKFGPQYVYEGCHDYEITGRLMVLHDLTLEGDIFTQSLEKYGNPYDFKCGRVYENGVAINQIDINNTIGASENYLPGAPSQLSNPIVAEG